MAHSNVDVVNRLFEAGAKGDLDGMRVVHADNIVYHVESFGVLSGTFRGVDEVMSWIVRIGEETKGTWRDETLSVLGDGDQVVILVRVTGRRGDRTLDTRGAQIYHLTDGKIDESWVAAEDGASVEKFFS